MTPAVDDLENALYHRHVSQHGNIELGIHPVLFGYRVRAGFIGAGIYELDWCGGDKQSDIELLFTIARRILTDRINFNGIPKHSKIKPFYKDSEFIDILTELSEQSNSSLSVEKIPDINLFRQDLFKKLNMHEL